MCRWFDSAPGHQSACAPAPDRVLGRFYVRRAVSAIAARAERQSAGHGASTLWGPRCPAEPFRGRAETSVSARRQAEARLQCAFRHPEECRVIGRATHCAPRPEPISARPCATPKRTCMGSTETSFAIALRDSAKAKPPYSVDAGMLAILVMHQPCMKRWVRPRLSRCPTR